MSDLHDDVFAISPDICYVGAAHGQHVQMRSRPDLRNASSSDSDLYEELLVNPATSVSWSSPVLPGTYPSPFEPGANPAGYLEAILGVIAHHGQPAA